MMKFKVGDKLLAANCYIWNCIDDQDITIIRSIKKGDIFTIISMDCKVYSNLLGYENGSLWITLDNKDILGRNYRFYFYTNDLSMFFNPLPNFMAYRRKLLR